MTENFKNLKGRKIMKKNSHKSLKITGFVTAVAVGTLCFCPEVFASHIQDLTTSSKGIWEMLNNYGSKMVIGGGTLAGGWQALTRSGVMAAGGVLAIGMSFLWFWGTLAG